MGEKRTDGKARGEGMETSGLVVSRAISRLPYCLRFSCAATGTWAAAFFRGIRIVRFTFVISGEVFSFLLPLISIKSVGELVQLCIGGILDVRVNKILSNALSILGIHVLSK
jgi:hypothetical protein